MCRPAQRRPDAPDLLRPGHRGRLPSLRRRTDQLPATIAALEPTSPCPAGLVVSVSAIGRARRVRTQAVRRPLLHGGHPDTDPALSHRRRVNNRAVARRTSSPASACPEPNCRGLSAGTVSTELALSIGHAPPAGPIGF